MRVMMGEPITEPYNSHVFALHCIGAGRRVPDQLLVRN
jgi:hypothetical protein